MNKIGKTKIGRCDVCDAERVKVTVVEQENPRHKEIRPTIDMCDLCYTTLLGIAYQFPSQYDFQNLKVIAQMLRYFFDKSYLIQPSKHTTQTTSELNERKPE